MIEVNWIPLVGIVAALMGAASWFGYRVGVNDGWSLGIRDMRVMFGELEEMTEVPYPQDVNVAKGILAVLEEDEEKRGERD